MIQTRQHLTPKTYPKIKNLPLRPPEVVMQPERLGAVWPTQFSFIRRILRRIQQEGWEISVHANTLDADGCGEFIYRIQTPSQLLHFVIFSQTIDETERTDRVIAERWDAAAALCQGELTAERLDHMRQNVPYQEYGRADSDTLVWTRGNRSSRFFNHVVESLAAGHQPDVDFLAGGGYILRSTAYYGNTKFGLAPFDSINPDHSLAGSFQSQMFAAFLFREFSCDLAEHIAHARSSSAVPLADHIRQFLGIGNATGMGLVPFCLNNPAVTHAWCMVREIALATAKADKIAPANPQIGQVVDLCDHHIRYFAQDTTDTKDLYAHQSTLIKDLEQIRNQLITFANSGNINGQLTPTPWQALCDWTAENCHIESQELLHALLIELYPELVEELQPYLDVPSDIYMDPLMTVGELIELIQRNYQWALTLNLVDETARGNFWYFSADSEEPLIGMRGIDMGEHVERPFDIPHQIQAVMADLIQTDRNKTLGEFLLTKPTHRNLILRIQNTHDLIYAEVHDNLLDKQFIPLQLQRFQLAMYGMERYSPMSIYWVRVTLLQGAPTAKMLQSDQFTDQWTFPLRPELTQSAL